MADFKVQSMTTANPTGPRQSRSADNPRKLGAYNPDDSLTLTGGHTAGASLQPTLEEGAGGLLGGRHARQLSNGRET
jgi:chitodextrinase